MCAPVCAVPNASADQAAQALAILRLSLPYALPLLSLYYAERTVSYPHLHAHPGSDHART
jgi:hypothetical protein